MANIDFEFDTADGGGGGSSATPVKRDAGVKGPPKSSDSLNFDALDDEFDSVPVAPVAVSAAPAAKVASPPTPQPQTLLGPEAAVEEFCRKNPEANTSRRPEAYTFTNIDPRCPQSGIASHLFFDLETVPDEDRMHLFGLPEIPEFTEKPDADCPPVEEASEWTVQAIESFVERENPEFTWLNRMVEAEQARGSGGAADKRKPRSGVFDALKKSLKAREANLSAHAARRKQMSLSPEMCRIVAVGWAVGETTPRSLVVGSTANEFSRGQPITEAQIIEHLWNLIARYSPIVGFNCLSFDLQVLRARSCILGVNPTKIINPSRYEGNRDVIDLATRRFGGGVPPQGFGLKQLCKLFGVIVKRPDLDGSQVERMLAEDPLELASYQESDIYATRDLFMRWRGFWTE